MQKLLEIGSKVKSVARGYEKVEAERELEQKMLQRGKDRFHRNVMKSKSKKNETTGKDKEPTESTTIYGQHLLQEAIDPVNIEIEKEIIAAEKEIKNLRKSSISDINNIAAEISSHAIKELINSDINKSNVSAIVNDITKRKLEKNIWL